MKTILLKFAGPLQSWGTDSNFETRYTDLHPSKSAVIGMIAASMGYRRHEDTKIQRLNELDFAVRIDYQGQIIKDYHIAQKHKKNGEFERTYVTERYYIEDGVFVVAIGHEQEDFINGIAESLKNPYFQTFLGRRSLPLTADFFIEEMKLDVIAALKKTPWQGQPWMTSKIQANQSCYVYADGDLISGKVANMRKDKVKSFDQKHRQFGFRSEKSECIILENPYFEQDEQEHDIFSVVGGQNVSIES
jgi:CRISPR system Cascade subunit CasD